MSTFSPVGLGWHRDLPDPRDYTPKHPNVQTILQSIKRRTTRQRAKSSRVDLREYFLPVDDQGKLQSSTAHACIALVQYFERRAHGTILEPSRLFLHQTTRRLLQCPIDASASLRDTIKAMVRFGIPPESLWPYDSDLTAIPDALMYSFAREFQPIRYFRLDTRNTTGSETLNTAKSYLTAGIPSVFGFPVPNSISRDADIPYRPTFDSARGGQAVLAVGYDDRRIRSSRGAILIRSSWGRDWGEDGYGWLPYAFIEQQLAVDFWSILKVSWLRSNEFENH